MSEEITESFGAALRKLREAAGVTQEELAAAATLSTRAISDLERGVNKTARKQTARLLAKALGLSGTQRAEFEAAARAGLMRAAMLMTLPATTHSLPAESVSFTGRQADLERLITAERPAENAVQISLIDGMAGVGKSTLAIRAGHILTEQYPDGQLLLRLYGHTVGHLPVAANEALATLLLMDKVSPNQIPSDIEQRESLWRDRTAGRRLLMILDDAISGEQVRRLLPGRGGSRVLVTSRNRLAALADALTVPLDVLPSNEAIALFISLCGKPGLEIDDESVARIVQICGYHPLAITLVAGRLKHRGAWTIADLADELASAPKSDLLALMKAETRSVAMSFEMSYRNVPAEGQLLFRQLGLIPGTDFDQYAAVALAGSDSSEVRSLLDELYQRNLINEQVKGRYHFHDLIREYASGLASSHTQDDDAALDRLIDYYAGAARHANNYVEGSSRAQLTDPDARSDMDAPELSTSDQAIAWFEAESANMRALAKLASMTRRFGGACRLAAAMHPYLRSCGHWAQAEALHAAALTAARDLNDRQAEAGALADLGDVLLLQGDYQGSAANLTLAISIFSDLGDKTGEASALISMGGALRMTGEYQIAKVVLNRARELFEDACYLGGTASALNYLGAVEGMTGDYSDAITHLSRALELCENLGDRLGQAHALTSMSSVRAEMGEAQEATRAARAALKLYRQLRNAPGEAGALMYLGTTQLAAGENISAGFNFSAALKLYRLIGSKAGEAIVLDFIGVVKEAIGDHAGALVSERLSFEICCSNGDRQGEANALLHMSVSYTCTGDYSQAAVTVDRATLIYHDIGDQLGEAESLNRRALLMLEIGDSSAAMACAQRSLDLYQSIGNRPGEVESLLTLGRLSLALGKVSDALARYEIALAMAMQIASRLHEARALEGLARVHELNGNSEMCVSFLARSRAVMDIIAALDSQEMAADSGM